jgi:hypothetical protein
VPTCIPQRAHCRLSTEDLFNGAPRPNALPHRGQEKLYNQTIDDALAMKSTPAMSPSDLERVASAKPPARTSRTIRASDDP